MSTALLQFMELYGPPAGEMGPVKMVHEVFGAKPDQWQINVLKDYGRGERQISVRSCRSAGKTTVAAWCAWHQLLTRFPQKSLCTAPSAPQLFDALYAELRTWYTKLPLPIQQLYEVKSDRIELKAAPTESFLSARTARPESPETMQGLNAPWVLLMIDEASGVDDAIYQAALGSMSSRNATILLLSNATRTTGFFHSSHHANKARWNTYHVSAIPGGHLGNDGYLTSRQSPDLELEIASEYERDSNPYRIMVMGEFPRADFDGIIPFELVDAATTRQVVASQYAPVIWGLDVAHLGDDLSALCKRKGNVVTEPIRVWSQYDTVQLVGAVMAEWDAAGTERPVEILVDGIGIGVGVAERLNQLGLPARGINVAELPAMRGTYKNLRTELWFATKQWFATRDCSIPKDDKLVAELVAQKYRPLPGSNLIIANPKRDMRRQIRRSPDRADALMMTFAGTAATALMGGTSMQWNQPLRRNLVGVV